MRFDAESRTLTLELRDCRTCEYGAGERGQYTGKKVCETCHGTGNGPRGGRRQCRGGCFGGGSVADFDNPITCPNCNGDWASHDSETFCDTAPAEAVAALPIRLVRQDRDSYWVEKYLGLGLFSVTDYGRRWEQDDEVVLAEVTEKVREDRTQATKILRPYERGQQVATLHDELVIVLNRYGYSVVAHSEAKEA